MLYGVTGERIVEMGHVHPGLGNAVVLTLLILSTECSGSVEMFKNKKERRNKGKAKEGQREDKRPKR